ncbi:FxsA family protein [Mumia sp. DW29H23]|uniref:FxsA family protein n=1 Tax=Mumia sp. DW29H23 TaxID=3421241 RepID=UPI003D69ABA9
MRRGIAAAFLLLPVAEIAVAVAVSQLVGVGPTLLALLALSVIGVLVLRDAGRRGWQAMRQATRDGVVPPQGGGRALTVVSGLLLAVPGFLTAAAGLLLFLPPVRSLVRRRTRRWVDRQGTWMVVDRFGRPVQGAGSSASGPASGSVVQGEVVDDQ